MNPPFQFRAHHAHDKPLLQDGRALRALKVLIDSPTWDRLCESDDIPDVMLRELLQDDRVFMTRYGDDGPPPDVERRRVDSPSGGGEGIGSHSPLSQSCRAGPTSSATPWSSSDSSSTSRESLTVSSMSSSLCHAGLWQRLPSQSPGSTSASGESGWTQTTKSTHSWALSSHR